MVIRTGDKAADFMLPSLNGQDIRLSDYLGKKLVLFMWASW